MQKIINAITKEDLKAIEADLAELKNSFFIAKSVFTPKEAALYIGISQSTLYKLTSAGIIPFSKPNGKLIYFSRAELDKWLLSNPSKSDRQKDTEASTYISINKK